MWMYNSGSLFKDHSPLVTSLFRICPIRSAFVESSLVRDVTSLLIFAILYTARVAGLIRCTVGGSPEPVTADVLENKDLRNLLARLMCMDIGNEARNFAVLTRCWGFVGEEEGFSSQGFIDTSSPFSSTGSKVESLEGRGSVGLAFAMVSGASVSEYRYFSTWSTSWSI